MTFSRLFPFAALVLSACAPAHVPWMNPHVPQEQWGRDWSACKSSAERSVLTYQPDSLSDAPFRDYDHAAAKGEIASATETCMISLGYVPAKKGR